MMVEPLLLCSTAADAAASPPTISSRISSTLRALLDPIHLLQLEQSSLSSEHSDGLELVGAELGIDPPTMFCQSCRDLLRSPPEPIDAYSEGGWVPFHKDLFDLIDCCHSLGEHCHLCQQFWRNIKFTIAGLRQNKENFKVELSKWGLKVRLEIDTNEYPEYRAARPEHTETFMKRYILSLNPEVLFNGVLDNSKPFGLEFIQDPLGKYSKNLDFALGDCSDSATTFSLIKHWLHNCERHHAECKIEHHPSPTKSPTRLVRIESSGHKFRLEERFSKELRYTALSYRWGTRPSITLRQDNLSQMREGLPTYLLPKTLRDACVITYRLGLRHIWIDRLCILQDLNQDWEHEAAKMADVYKNSWCTISATGAREENNGCFFPRNPLEITPLRLSSNPFVDGSFCLTSQNHYGFNHDRTTLGYLQDRAWTFQERNLSRRILHFGKDQVSWQCMRHQANELWPLGYPNKSTRPTHLSGIKDQYDAMRRWTKIVREYSRGRLTFENDKLPALSGMAEEMSRASGDEYLAGLWREDLLLGLCWEVKKDSRRPTSYRAPSWSWASLDGIIDNGPAWWLEGLSQYPAMSTFVDIQHARVDLSGSNPFGQVSGGWIALSGHLLQVSIRSELISPLRKITGEPLELVDSSMEYLDSHSTLLTDGSIPILCLPLLSIKLRWTCHENVFCLLLISWCHNHNLFNYQLSDTGDPSLNMDNMYHRVGLAELDLLPQVDYRSYLESKGHQTVIIS